MDYAYEDVKKWFNNDVITSFYDFAQDDNMKNELNKILKEGKIGNNGLGARFLCKDNPRIEAQRRISMAYLLVNDRDAYEYLKEVAKAIPVAVKNPVILVSTPLYREYMQDLVAANLYHFDPANGENEYKLPGTDIRVIAVDGLNGVENVIAADMANLFYGVSADEDSDTFDLWYSKDNREFRLAINFIAGVQVAFPNEVVLGKRG